MPDGRIWVVHGWNVRDNSKSIGSLIPYLEEQDLEVRSIEYGHVLTRTATRHKTTVAAQELAAQAEPLDGILCHSNGAVAGRLASIWQHVPMVYMIRPALDPHLTPGSLCCRVHYHPRDRTRWARWVPLSTWGNMGAQGPRRHPHQAPYHFDVLRDKVADHSPWRGEEDEWARTIATYYRSARRRAA